MADFGLKNYSLKNYAFAAAIAVGSAAPNAADAQQFDVSEIDTSKFSVAVVEDCKNKTAVALADLKAKIEVANAKPGVTPELKEQRMARLLSQAQITFEGCLATFEHSVIMAELGRKETNLGKKSEDLGKKSEDLGKKSEDLGKKETELKKKETELDILNAGLEKVNSRLDEINTEMKSRVEFLNSFMAGNKTRAEYNNQIASLNQFIQGALATIAQAKVLLANHPRVNEFDKAADDLRKLASMAGIKVTSL